MMHMEGMKKALRLGVAMLAVQVCRAGDVGSPEPGRDWTSPATGMEFVWIEPMNLWVGKYEVTNAEYRKKIPNHDSRDFEGHTLNEDRQPVVYVNFAAALSYAQWLTEQDRAHLDGMTYQLPTQREWMTFAQCGDGRKYPWGDDWPPPSDAAGNYSDRIEGYTSGHHVSAPVGEVWANPWGLHGVGGNVMEACARNDNRESFGAWRGASWRYFGEPHLRCSASKGVAIRTQYDGGFRLVLLSSATAQPEEEEYIPEWLRERMEAAGQENN